MMSATLRGKPDAGNPHVRFDEGEVAPAKPRRGSLLYMIFRTPLLALLLCGLASFKSFGSAAELCQDDNGNYYHEFTAAVYATDGDGNEIDPASVVSIVPVYNVSSIRWDEDSGNRGHYYIKVKDVYQSLDFKLVLSNDGYVFEDKSKRELYVSAKWLYSQEVYNVSDGSYVHIEEGWRFSQTSDVYYSSNDSVNVRPKTREYVFDNEYWHDRFVYNTYEAASIWRTGSASRRRTGGSTST